MMLQKMASIDAQMRLLVPKRVSEDDKLIEYDALLLDRFLDVLEELHGSEIKDKVAQDRSQIFFSGRWKLKRKGVRV
jgi:phosphoenolpyruvate carboxylase